MSTSQAAGSAPDSNKIEPIERPPSSDTNTQANESDDQPPTLNETPHEGVTQQRDARFWLIFVALCSTTLLSAIDLGGIGTAAPTIAADLGGEDLPWVAAAYSLSSSACIPLSGNLAQVFGRRPILMAAIVVFAAGSAVCGSAETMVTLIIGRAVQGIGGGGVQALTTMVFSDLVPLRDRGIFQGITGVVWTAGTSIGPFIAGSLSEKATWRWLFYLNLPLCLIAFFVVLLFLNLHTPRDALRKKLAKIDWVGNGLIIASTCSVILGLTFGGVRWPWSSPRVIAPIVLGIVGLGLSLLYEFNVPSHPTIPRVILSNRTTFAGYLGTFLQNMVMFSATFYLPTWFQAVRGASPIMSAVYYLPLVAVISPTAVLQGIVVSKTGRYRMLNLAGWCLALLGCGLLCAIRPNTSLGAIVVIQLITGFGGGLLYTTTFAVLAPLPLSDNPMAVSLLVFLRVFSQAWGVAIGGAILQNVLQKRLPHALLESAPNGTEIAYSLIPNISSYDEPTKTKVQEAFFDSLRLVWVTMASLCGVGLLSFFVMKDIPLRRTVDNKWGVVGKDKPATTPEPRDQERNDTPNNEKN